MAKLPTASKGLARTLQSVPHAAPAKLAAGKVVDMALIGSSLAAAAGSVAFAGFMLMQGDHPPNVNGLQYLAIFAQPKGALKSDGTSAASTAAISSAAPAQSLPAASAPPLDMSPVGAIGASPGYELVSAQAGLAWVRAGGRIFPVRPGDELPGLGLVRAVAWGDGRWTVIGDDGAPLLTSGPPAPAKDGSGKAPFSRMMIFGPDN